MTSFNTLEPQTNSLIRRMVRSTGMPLKTFADASGLKNAEALDWWSGQSEPLTFKHLLSLSQFIGVSVENLISNSYSWDMVRQRIFEGPSALPEKYANHASSFVRTSAHIVEYLSMMYGRHFVDQLLLKLNIHPLLFDNLENRINLQFFIDFLNQLSLQGLPDGEIDSLACYLFLRLKDTEIGALFAQASTYEESYQVLSEIMPKLEENFSYQFIVESDKLQIIAEPTDANLFLESNNFEEYKRLFSYRKKAFGWFPVLSHLSPLTLQTPRCLIDGDHLTVYESELPKARPTDLFSEKRSLRLI